MQSILASTIFMQILSLSLSLLVSVSAQAEQIAASGMGEASVEGVAAPVTGQDSVKAMHDQAQAHAKAQAEARAQADYETSGLLCTERINLLSRIARDNGPMTIAIPFLRNFRHRERVYQGEELILWMPTSGTGSAFEKKVSLRCFGTSGHTDDYKPFAKIDCVDAKKEYMVGIHTVGRVFVKVAIGLNQLKRSSKKTSFSDTTYFNCRRAQEF